ncbi:ATP-binding protein [Pseudonocardiaceae bacterium YIM PH 21723]|nr:ATP-binding protein [Pseudonocardiaceae bacterium YIM PH 21723]
MRSGAEGAVLFVHGQPGIGKTALLRHLSWLAGQAGDTVVWLDGDELGPEPLDATRDLGAALGLRPDADPLAELSRRSGVVLLLDNADLRLLGPAADDWLRDALLPALPSDVVVVLAGREPPALRWRTDPGWRGVLRTIRLGPLDEPDGRELLRLRGMPDAAHPAALAMADGLPLTLTLAADVHARTGGRLPAVPGTAAPEALLKALVEHAPSRAHRAAIQACAQAPALGEPLLATLLDLPDATDIHRWLADLSFVDTSRRGLRMQEFARAAIPVDPELRSTLRARAHDHYRQHLRRGDPAAVQRVLADFGYLHRDCSLLTQAHPDRPDLRVTGLRAGEWSTVRAIIERHEGAESATIAEHWHTRQPEAVRVVREAADRVTGVLLLVELSATGERDRAPDPAAVATWAELDRHDRPAPGELVPLVRHWMAVDGYQNPSPVQACLTLYLVRRLLTTPRVGQVFFGCAEPTRWSVAFGYAGFARLPAAGFRVGGWDYAVFGHDWREVSPADWLARLGGPAVETAPRRLLDAAGFAAAVLDALRDYPDPGRLATGTLARSRFVAAGGREPGPAVRSAIELVATTMRHDARDRRLLRAVELTFLEPAGTQARAAELLGLPMSTYRRHLAGGVQRITELLWQAELGIR